MSFCHAISDIFLHFLVKHGEFEYHIEDAARYIQSNPDTVESDISPYISLIEYRIDDVKRSNSSAKEMIANSLHYIITNYDAFKIDLDIFGDLKNRSSDLIAKLR